MIALAYAGGFGLAAVILYALAALATLGVRRVPMLSAALAAGALVTTAVMVVAALYGLLELAIGVIS